MLLLNNEHSHCVHCLAATMAVYRSFLFANKLSRNKLSRINFRELQNTRNLNLAKISRPTVYVLYGIHISYTFCMVYTSPIRFVWYTHLLYVLYGIHISYTFCVVYTSPIRFVWYTHLLYVLCGIHISYMFCMVYELSVLE